MLLNQAVKNGDFYDTPLEAAQALRIKQLQAQLTEANSQLAVCRALIADGTILLNRTHQRKWDEYSKLTSRLKEDWLKRAEQALSQLEDK